MHRAAADWADTAVRQHPNVLAVGYFGSYARGDWGFGSDLDLIVIVDGQLPPIGERARTWDTLSIPVPVDLLLYTRDEWQRWLQSSPRMAETMAAEGVWLWRSPSEVFRSRAE